MSLTETTELTARLAPYQELIESELSLIGYKSHISLFYDPIRYFLSIPGKRIRPLLVLLAAEALGQQAAHARFAAAAVELLHNFTLVHDDIMDNDDTRRGQLTVHKKWDMSTAILTGDGLMGFAFQKLLKSSSGDLNAMARRFTETMIVICEGQGQDKMFEDAGQIQEADYLEMIAHKTAVLLELSCELGAMNAQADESQIQLFKDYGYALGMGFQIQDDLLDIMGESSAIGKAVGSDLQMHKQTILTIKLQQRYPQKNLFNLSIDAFRELLNESGVLQEVEQMYTAHFNNAYHKLDLLPASSAKDILIQLTKFIQQRQW